MSLLAAARTPFAIVMGTLAAVTVSAAPKASVPQPPPPKIEFGLEKAIVWKWWVLPTNPADWALTMEIAGPPKPGAGGAPGAPLVRPGTYEVQRGDALVKIGNKFGVTPEQLKVFNNLKGDLIHVGDLLKIPNLEDIKKMAPPPPPPLPSSPGDKKSSKAAPPPQVVARRELNLESGRNFDTVLMQVFLDREQFATGSIDGRSGPALEKITELYQSTHDGMQDPLALKEKARSVVDDPFAVYTLKAEDFRFIAPPSSAAVVPVSAGGRRSRRSKTPTEPPPTYEELVLSPRLIYRSPWEFVAERFHCEEAFLRSLNSNIKGVPATGVQFHVPNVVPFEVEKVFETAVQPAANPAKPITAAIVGLSRLEVYRSGSLIAVMPVALARPDLRGRGTWTVLQAIPGPRLATLQELKPPPKPSTPSGMAAPLAPVEPPPPPPAPALQNEQYLAAGPNNPVGVVWINLAKSKDGQPLPYGLHGTSIPDRMRTLEGIGGLRLANWDILRAARLLPAGTPLQWKQ